MVLITMHILLVMMPFLSPDPEGAILCRLSQSTGVLAKFGYTPSGGGTAHRFPIAIGALP